MASKNIPDELKSDYENISTVLKKRNPNLKDSNLIESTWELLKKRYYKDVKSEIWKLKDKFKSSIGEDIEAFMSLYFKREDYKNDYVKNNPKNLLHIEARASIIERPKDLIVAQEDWKKTYLNAGIEAELDVIADDILYVRYSLAHSSPYENDNRYVFSPEDLKSCVTAGQFEPTSLVMVDINHNYIPYGVVLKANTYQEELGMHGTVTTLECIAGIWAWRFPGLVDDMKALHAANSLKWSMACSSDSVKCGVCNKSFPTISQSCEHIWNKEGPIYVIGPHFAASSIIMEGEVPADRYANSTEVYLKNTGPTSPMPDEAYAYVNSKQTPKVQLFVHHDKDGVVSKERIVACFTELLENKAALSTADQEKVCKHLKLHTEELNLPIIKDNYESLQEEINMTIEELTAKLEKVQAELDTAKTKISKFEAVDVKKDIEANEKEIKDLKQKIADLETAAVDLNANITTADGEKTALESQITTLEKSVTDLEAEKVEMTDKLSEFEQDAIKAAVITRNEARVTKIESLKETLTPEKITELKEKYILSFNETDKKVEGIPDVDFDNFFEGVALVKGSKTDRSLNFTPNPEDPDGLGSAHTAKIDKFFVKISPKKKQ